MRTILPRGGNIRKISQLAIVVNAAQIAAAVATFLFALQTHGEALSQSTERVLLGAMALIVCWGAVVDIREARNALRLKERTDMLTDAYSQLETLNGTLRAQRHDFMNHLQVVYSLSEMGEYAEAQHYIERVYGDIQRVGKSLRTAIPAVNALLAAKMNDAESRGICLVTEFHSAWEGLCVPGWELCRVLGNLIDNAIDALSERTDADGRIRVALSEDVREYGFSVVNNGAMIPENIQAALFEKGFTTKSEGHGMGLSIVKEIIGAHGGAISVRSTAEETCFYGTFPKSS